MAYNGYVGEKFVLIYCYDHFDDFEELYSTLHSIERDNPEYEIRLCVMYHQLNTLYGREISTHCYHFHLRYVSIDAQNAYIVNEVRTIGVADSDIERARVMFPQADVFGDNLIMDDILRELDNVNLDN